MYSRVTFEVSLRVYAPFPPEELRHKIAQANTVPEYMSCRPKSSKETDRNIYLCEDVIGIVPKCG
jgi:hypothetical protein